MANAMDSYSAEDEILSNREVVRRLGCRICARMTRVCAAVRRLLVRALSGYYERRAQSQDRYRPRSSTAVTGGNAGRQRIDRCCAR
jgi:phosphoribosyl-dephospho-CoA transferase